MSTEVQPPTELNHIINHHKVFLSDLKGNHKGRIDVEKFTFKVYAQSKEIITIKNNDSYVWLREDEYRVWLNKLAEEDVNLDNVIEIKIAYIIGVITPLITSGTPNSPDFYQVHVKFIR